MEMVCREGERREREGEEAAREMRFENENENE